MESDYKMLMMILSKNMSEGSDERTAIIQPVTPEKTPTSKYLKSTRTKPDVNINVNNCSMFHVSFILQL